MKRNSQGFLVPFRETHIYTSSNAEYTFPVKSIRFGPSLEKERTEYSIKLFLKYLHTTNDTNQINILDEIEVMESNINLRR